MNARNTKHAQYYCLGMSICTGLMTLLLAYFAFAPRQTPPAAGADKHQQGQVVEKEVELSNGAVVLCLIVHTEHGQTMSCDWQRAVPPKTARPNPKVL